MTRSQIQQLVVIFLLVAFVAVWFLTRKTPPLVSPPAIGSPSVATPPSPMLPSPPPPASEDPLPTEEIVLNRDPFQLPSPLKEAVRQREILKEQPPTPPPQEAPPIPTSPPPLQLQGVFWGTPRPSAIINRRILYVGDTIDNAKILAVTKDGVTASYGGQEFQLRLPEPNLQGSRGERRPEWSP